jgi:hypothetical protein
MRKRHLRRSPAIEPRQLSRRIIGSSQAVTAVLAWFTFLHDSQRHYDGGDPQRSHRAAEVARGLRRRRIRPGPIVP